MYPVLNIKVAKLQGRDIPVIKAGMIQKEMGAERPSSGSSYRQGKRESLQPFSVQPFPVLSLFLLPRKQHFTDGILEG